MDQNLLLSYKRAGSLEIILGGGKFAQAALEKLNETDKDKEEELEKLLIKVASFYGLTIQELCSGSKRTQVSKARAVAIYLC